MSQQVIGAGPGNNQVLSEVRQYKCGGTIAIGEPIAFADATAVAALVVTYGAGTYLDGAVIAPADLDAAKPIPYPDMPASAWTARKRPLPS